MKNPVRIVAIIIVLSVVTILASLIINPRLFNIISRRTSVNIINDTQLDLQFHPNTLDEIVRSERFSFLDDKWSPHTLRILNNPDPEATYVFSNGSSSSSSVEVNQLSSEFEIIIGINIEEGREAQLEHINRNYLLALYSYYQKPVLSEKNNLRLLDDITNLMVSNRDEPLYLLY